MHEMAITKDILRVTLDYADSVQAQRVKKVALRTGVLCNFIEEYVQRYFTYLSKGTKAEGAEINLVYIPIMVECAHCGCEFKIEKDEMDSYTCPQCGCEEGTLIAGGETFIDEVVVEK